MLQDEEISEFLLIANQALVSVSEISEIEGNEVREKMKEMIQLLENKQDPITWDFSILTYGTMLARTFDSPEYNTKLEPVYRFYDMLLQYCAHNDAI